MPDRVRRLLTLGLVACSQTLPASSTTILVEQTAAKPAHLAFSTVPAELGDDDVLARIRHRVRVRWLHRASAIHGEAMEPIINRTPSSDIDRILPVIGESETEVRVVVEDDDARLALWIDRRDTWPTLLVPIQLGDREGHVPRTTGAFLSTGAPIDLAFGRDRIRHVTLRDAEVAVDGWVPASVIGNVWIAGDGDVKTHVATFSHFAFHPPADLRPTTKFVAHATLRAAPDPAAPIVGIVVGDIVGFVNTKGAWSDVEVVREYARIRGFIRASELKPDDDTLETGGTGGGTGFGMSHSDRIVVPTGTCLYDKIGGAVVGVAIKEAERHGERETAIAGWSRVYIDSPWAVLGFFVHDTGSEPKQPVWESCAKR